MRSIQLLSCLVVLLIASTHAVKGRNSTKQADSLYLAQINRHYQSGDVDSLKIVSYQYMAWCEKQHKEVPRYQTWRQYVQRLTEKGMQQEAIDETERLRQDAEKKKSRYGEACSEMCIGYNHRVFSNNIKRCIDYYNNALKLFEAAEYYEDAFVVYLNITQIHLPRREYTQAAETLQRLDKLVATMRRKNVSIEPGHMLRFYQFRVIATLAHEGEKAAQRYIAQTDQFYFRNIDCMPRDAWYGYKVMCAQTLNDGAKTVVYLDSLDAYNRSIGACYPANDLYRAKCLQQLGRLDEACQAFARYAAVNDSVRTCEMNEELSKYTVEFEVNKLKMEQLELNAENSRSRFAFVCSLLLFILVVLLILVFFYLRSLAMNKKLALARQEVLKASQMKSSFIRHITHEIRTPLNSIVGFSSLLAEGGVDEEDSKDYSNQINSSNAYLLELINNIIDMADMDSQTFDVPRKTIDANLCCLECIEQFRSQVNPSVELQYTPSASPLLMTTVLPWVKQVLHVLLSNANKFTPSGIIRLRCEEDKTRHLMRIIVEDTGIGIPSPYQEFLFDRFYKVDHFTAGTGLGLSIARQIMEMVGGRIYLDATYTSGARFVTEWPM
ncbi:MAG: HAMP domain-containing sensor histidine kinase [Bacteroides sp.]